MTNDIKVLFVEDNDATRHSFYKILKKRYFEDITCALDGEEGLALFRQNRFDLVISDLMMPKRNGTSMLEKIKEIDPAVSTVLISGHDSREELLKAIELGVDKFILKPINYVNLDSTLNKIIKNIQAANSFHALREEANTASKLMHEYKKAVDESTIFSIGDLQGRIKYANRQFREVSGYSLEELQGKPHSIVRHPDMPKEAFKDMWETIANKKVWKGMVKNKKKNGEPYYVDATIVPILDDSGEVMEYAGIRDDITDLINKEKELENFKDRQRARDVQKALEIQTRRLVEAVPFPSLFFDEAFNIVSMNQAFKELYFSEEQLSSFENASELFIPKDECLSHDQTMSIYDKYELAIQDPVVTLDINGEEKQFIIGIKKEEQGYLATIVEKG